MINRMVDEAKKTVQSHMEAIPLKSAEEVMKLPAGVMQTKTNYSTAVQVVRPRVLREVENRCLEEAALMGERCYYSWKQGGEPIEGLSVDAALMAVRNWGNCAIDTRVEETADAYIFYAAYIDLESGFNLVRAFRQRKESPKKKSGEAIYSGERGQDVIFQIGQSKGIRNVALNALPSWLKDKLMEKGKENVVARIENMGIEKARSMVITKAGQLGIEVDRVEAEYGRQASWETKDIVQISSALRQIEDGVEKDTDLFPVRVGEATVEPPKSEKPSKAEKVAPPKEKVVPEASVSEKPLKPRPPESPTVAPSKDAEALMNKLIAQINDCDHHAEVSKVFGEASRSRDNNLLDGDQYFQISQAATAKTKALNKKARGE